MEQHRVGRDDHPLADWRPASRSRRRRETAAACGRSRRAASQTRASHEHPGAADREHLTDAVVLALVVLPGSRPVSRWPVPVIVTPTSSSRRARGQARSRQPTDGDGRVLAQRSAAAARARRAPARSRRAAARPSSLSGSTAELRVGRSPSRPRHDSYRDRVRRSRHECGAWRTASAPKAPASSSSGRVAGAGVDGRSPGPGTRVMPRGRTSSRGSQRSPSWDDDDGRHSGRARSAQSRTHVGWQPLEDGGERAARRGTRPPP